MASNLLPPHLVRLPGSEWNAWRCVALRSPGFEVGRVLQLAAPRLVRAVEEMLEAELGHTRALEAAQGLLWRDVSREQDPVHKSALRGVASRIHRGLRPAEVRVEPDTAAALQALEAAVTGLAEAKAKLPVTFQEEESSWSAGLRALAARDDFKEALVWQNRAVLHSAVEPLLRDVDASPNRATRKHQLVVANYLQRYCTKNDTIGFFGPLGWATFREGGAALEFLPGPKLVAHRAVYFETWCMDAVAEKLSERVELRGWLCPRMLPYFQVSGQTMSLPSGEQLELGPVQARVLQLCDGRHTAKEISAQVGHETEVQCILEQSQARGVLTWDLQLPLDRHPERLLLAALDRVEDPELRALAQAPVLELERHRERVAQAAGDAAALDRAMRELESCFTAFTGKQPTRSSGETYGYRTLVYEDCRRDAECTLGTPLLESLSLPLSLVLQSVRWFTHELAQRYEKALVALHGRLAQQLGRARLPMAVFQKAFLESPELNNFEGRNCALVLETTRELQRRWGQILGVDSAAHRVDRVGRELQASVNAAFACEGPGWSAARYTSFDMMFEGQGRGQPVLGEMHLHNNLLISAAVSQHPHPEELFRAFEADFPHPTVIPMVRRADINQRRNLEMSCARDFRYEYLPEPPTEDARRPLRIGELFVEPRGSGLKAVTRDGGIAFDLVEFFGFYLSILCAEGAFKLLPPTVGHSPRIAVDGVVLSRERWTLPSRSLSFAWVKDREERFVEARRWARGLGLPRFLFVKVPTEPKPVFLDLEAPLLVENFAKMVRNHAESGDLNPNATLEEMLPDVAATWVVDASGEHYTGELRILALDPVHSPRAGLLPPD